MAIVKPALVAPAGRFLKVNPSLCSLVGRTERELLASTFQDITHPDDLEADLALYTAVLAGERDGYRMDKRYLQPDGTVIWVQLYQATPAPSTNKMVSTAHPRAPNHGLVRCIGNANSLS